MGRADNTIKLTYEKEELKATTPAMVSALQGVIQTVSTAPTHIPKKFSEQILIYRSGATIRLYVYDTVNNAWRYTALT